MAKDILGVEIGASRVKLVQVSKGSVVKFCTLDVPEGSVVNGEVAAWEAMADVLKQGLKENGFSAKRAALVLPDMAAYVRRMKMPAMNASQLMVNLPYEFADIIQEDKEKYVFDYALIETVETDTGRQMDLFGGAVSKELLEQYQKMLSRAGLKLVKAAPRVLCLQSLLHHLDMDETKDAAILDLGFYETKVDIFCNGIYEATRSIDAGLLDAAKAVADKRNCDVHVAKTNLMSDQDHISSDPVCQEVYTRIAVEVMRAVNYYTYENPENHLEEICYTGYGSNNPTFIETIASAVSLPLNPLSQYDEPDVKAMLNGDAALGICMTEGE